MYGKYGIPCMVHKPDCALSVERDEGFWRYRRNACGTDPLGVEKTLLISRGSILIQPVEPVNLPEPVCRRLLISLKRPVVLQAGSRQTVYLTFPIEIGIFLLKDIQLTPVEILDVFSITQVKYTLYGDINDGQLCRYWESDLYSEPPERNILEEGVMELLLTNRSEEIVEVTKAVFNAYHMKIHYDHKRVSLRALMNVTGESTAETDCENVPMLAGMKKAVELYASRRLMMLPSRFNMEAGI